MNQNTSVTRVMKLNVTPLPAKYHQIIAKIEKKKSAKNLLRRFLFQLKDKIVMMKTKKYV